MSDKEDASGNKVLPELHLSTSACCVVAVHEAASVAVLLAVGAAKFAQGNEFISTRPALH